MKNKAPYMRTRAAWAAVLLSLGCVFCAHGAKFDARAWLEKRAALEDEAQRLRAEYKKCFAALTIPAENVIVPVENYPDGRVKSSIAAEKAQFFLDTGFVWGEGVTASQFGEDGSVQVSVTAANCIIDRKNKCGWADGRAKITYGGTTIEGAQVYFSLEEEYIMVNEGTKIVSTDLKLGGLKL